MRLFFFLLILTNLALAGWLYLRIETPQSMSEPAMDPANGRLQLLSDLPQQSLLPIPHEPPVPQTPPITNNVAPAAEARTSTAADDGGEADESEAKCIRISPLAKSVDVETLSRKLVQANLSVVDSGEEFSERVTYWVMIPPYKTDKAARDAGALLAKAKVRDFLVVRSGEHENSISLGLFSQKDGAENRLREILELKLNIRKPEIRLRASSVRGHWLVTQVRSDAALSKLQSQLQAEGLHGAPVECKP